MFFKVNKIAYFALSTPQTYFCTAKAVLGHTWNKLTGPFSVAGTPSVHRPAATTGESVIVGDRLNLKAMIKLAELEGSEQCD